MVKNILLAGIGGFIGSTLRYLCYVMMKNFQPFIITLLINVMGSFIIGMVFGLCIRNTEFEINWKIFLATGVCGGFTTFSAFSLENIQLLQQGKVVVSLMYMTSAFMLGILACFLGYKISV